MIPGEALGPYGWTDRWAALHAERPELAPGRVVRHDGVALVVATDGGPVVATFPRDLDPSPAVGDWVGLRDERAVTVLHRASLLRRRAASGVGEQALAANVDTVLLVCGLDRPVKVGRIRRGVTLARDAGADPVVVLTKATRPGVEPAAVAVTTVEVAQGNPGVPVLVTSVQENLGMPELWEVVEGRTVVLLGESGAGKSSMVNALLGAEAAATGSVRDGDAKGRHTTTSRQLHLLPGGGVLIDTPGIREVGLWVDVEAVRATFNDIDELAEECRFTDCQHQGQPGCAIEAAMAAGELAPDRLAAWRELTAEAAAAALRADPATLHRQSRKFGRIAREAQKRKGRT
jgi:ribosome biogenesis GTPase